MNGLTLSTAFEVQPAHLVLRYEVTNHAARDAYLLNRLFRTTPQWNISPDVIYVHLEPETETVWLNKKLADIPSGVNVAAPVAPFVTPLRAGTLFRETVRVPLPVREYRQYSMGPPPDEKSATTRVYKYVYFTLGYYWRPEGTTEMTQVVQGSEVVMPRTPPGKPLEFGRLVTERYRLDIPVIEFPRR